MGVSLSAPLLKAAVGEPDLRDIPEHMKVLQRMASPPPVNCFSFGRRIFVQNTGRSNEMNLTLRRVAIASRSPHSHDRRFVL